MTGRNLRKQQAGLFLLFSYEKDRLEIGETAYENKNREGFILACTCLSPIFFSFFGSPILGFVPATACWERGERRLTKSLQQACAGSAILSLVNLYIIIFSSF